MRHPLPAPPESSLLAALPPKELRVLAKDMELVSLAYGEILYEPGKAIQHVYFPNDSLVSLLTMVDRHQALEVGLVGREGMVGLALAMDVRTSPVRALVQGAGTAMRMPAEAFLKALKKNQALQRLMRLYTADLMAQITQTAACNRFHFVAARLARWLLMTHDRLRVNPFHLTQEFLSHMLGVRRVGVTKAASALQKSKLISYTRGSITILDRKGLEAASCTCYKAVLDLTARASATPAGASRSSTAKGSRPPRASATRPRWTSPRAPEAPDSPAAGGRIPA